MIYLDNAASTKPSDAVLKTLNEVISCYGNPSSLHTEGQTAKRIINDSKDKIARRIGNGQIFFTSGATMSNCLFIQGWLRKYPNGRLMVSAIEHNDIIMLADYYEEHGSDVVRIPVNEQGFVNMKTINLGASLARAKGVPCLCVVQAANGECGTIQDIQTICKVVHEYDGILYSDVTQYIPYFPIPSEIDAFGMSGQKINSIKGTGLLYMKDGLEIDPIIFGEQGLIGGTENVLGIACLATAFGELDYESDSLRQKQRKLIEGLTPYGRLIGTTDLAKRIPNNVYIAFDKYDFESLVVLLDGFGVEVSAGSACSSGKPSRVVLKMGYDEKVARACVRFSLSKDTSDEDIDETIRITREILTL